MPKCVDPFLLQDWLSGPKPFLELPADTDPGSVLDALCAQGFAPHRVDLADVSDKAGLLDVLHRALDLGDWFGFNWDALEDALYGPEDRSAPVCVLIVTGFTAFRARAPRDADVVIDIVRTVAENPASGLRGCVLIG
jgi:RNAse (barnase) inhibitor barstar